MAKVYAGDGTDCGVWLLHRSIHVVVFGEPLEYFMMWNRMFGADGVVYCGADHLNIALPQVDVAAQVQGERGADVPDVNHREYRHVVRAVRDHCDQPERAIICRRRGARIARRSGDYATFLGTLGLFTFLFFLFIRLLPMIPMSS